VKPAEFANKLRHIATGIEKSKHPDRSLVVKDIKHTLALMLDRQSKINIDYLVPLDPNNQDNVDFSYNTDDVDRHQELTEEIMAVLDRLENGKFEAMSGGHDNIARYIELSTTADKMDEFMEEIEAIINQYFPWAAGGTWKRN